MKSSFIKLFQLSIFVLILCCSSCKKFLDVGNPPDKIVAKYVYSTNSAAASVLTGIYFDFQRTIAQGRTGISMIAGVMSDETKALPFSVVSGFYLNNQYPDFWSTLYSYIYRVNTALDGLATSTALTASVHKQLEGEAKFMRAFCYFYLVNFYGDVPLLTTSNYKVNMVAARTAVDMVNEQIIADLLDAQQLLNDGFVDADAKNQSDERVRPCKWAATALLARVYLYRNKWSDAIMQASAVINNKALFDTVSLNDVFLKNSKEAIWQLQSVDVNNLYRNTQDAKYFVLTDDGPSGFNHPVWASSYLLNAFEEGDLRRTNWIGDLTLDDITYSYFYKYKLNRPFEDPGEYLMVLRLAEQYLIRAEAMAEQGDFTGAKKDLNVIRHRAGLEDIDAATKGPLLAAILHERQIELFMEWGHRWFDLKRTGKMDALMEVVTPGKGGNWAPYKKVLPIPLNDLRLNHNLTQNEGYPSS